MRVEGRAEAEGLSVEGGTEIMERKLRWMGKLKR